MSTFLLVLSNKVLKFFYKMRLAGKHGGRDGVVGKGTWAFQKKILQGSADMTLASPGTFGGNSRVSAR